MSRPQVIEALAICLERVESGLSVDEALADFPELRDEIAPLLVSAMSVRSLPAWNAPPGHRRETLAEIARLEEERDLSATFATRLVGFTGAGQGRLLARVSVAVIAIALVLGVVMVPVLAGSNADGIVDALRDAAERISGGAATHGLQPTDAAPKTAEGSDSQISFGAQSSATVVSRLVDVTRSPTLGTYAVVTDTLSTTLESTPFLHAPTEPVTATAVASAPTAHTPTSPPPSATNIPPAQPRPTDTDRPRDTDQPPPSPVPATDSPPPTLTGSPEPTTAATQTPRPGSVVVSGWVKHDDQTPGGRPLMGAGVLLYRTSDIDCSGPEPSVGEPFRQTATIADGAYSFGVPPGEYLLAAEGGPECLSRLWHVSPSDPGVGDPCSAFVLALPDDGMAFTFANILYDEIPGCPLAAPRD